MQEAAILQQQQKQKLPKKGGKPRNTTKNHTNFAIPPNFEEPCKSSMVSN
jgi:hypothetical protein